MFYSMRDVFERYDLAKAGFNVDSGGDEELIQKAKKEIPSEKEVSSAQEYDLDDYENNDDDDEATEEGYEAGEINFLEDEDIGA